MGQGNIRRRSALLDIKAVRLGRSMAYIRMIRNVKNSDKRGRFRKLFYTLWIYKKRKIQFPSYAETIQNRA